MDYRKDFRFRAFISILTAFSFVVLAMTGAILYITPPGRIANWTTWTFWQLSKHQWIALHICFSTVFLLAAVIHTWLNFKTLTSYFIRKAKTTSALRTEWIAAFIACGVVCIGALYPFKPFSSLLNLNERIKFSWAKPRQQPPVFHAELLTIAELAEKSDLEVDVIQLNLRNNGIEIGYTDIFGDIAKQHNMSPDELFAIATGSKAASSENGGRGDGFGQKTLNQVCEEIGIEPDKAIEALKSNNIEATGSMRIRDIADQNNLHPSKIRQILENQ